MIRYLTAGESHGEAVIGIVEGMPAGVPLLAEDINTHLARRWLGFGRGGRAKFERDKVHFYSGVRFSKTMGGPIAMAAPPVMASAGSRGSPAGPSPFRGSSRSRRRRPW